MKIGLALTFALLLFLMNTPAQTTAELAETWDNEHVSNKLPSNVRHKDLQKYLDGLRKHGLKVDEVGKSVANREIYQVEWGKGPLKVFLWSQMHGDEPTATSALIDIFNVLHKNRDKAWVKEMEKAMTIRAVPMLNPDGAELYVRRNLQGIDINRDALRLQTPEGRTLKAVRDRLQPRVGFNLHNQSWRTSVGDPPKPASISLLSVAFDKARSGSEGRTLTKKICAVIRDALEPFASGQIGRYDDEFEVRAFGDNLTLWGTPVVLIETGPWPAAEPDPALVRLNFVAILAALDALATGAVNRAAPERYDSLPLNASAELYVLVRNATVINGAGVPPYVADIGIAATRRVRDADGQRQVQITTTIDDMGDLRTLGALRVIDATGMTAIPLVSETVAAGQVVDLPEWRLQQAATINVGQPGRLVLLKPAGEPGKYQIELVLK